MKKYKVVIDIDALTDIQNATNWYNEQSAGAGTRFQKQVKSQINALKNSPLTYSIRYADVRCMLVKSILSSFISLLILHIKQLKYLR